MAKNGAEIINIMRNVTGRVDASDPLFTDSIMLQYLNDFLNLIMPQEVRLYENKTWWDFDIDETSPDPYPVDLEALGFTTIGPPAFIRYVDGSVTAGNNLFWFDLFWYQSPSIFYNKWPQVSPLLRQRPQDVLYYNNQLVFRGAQDQAYTVRIQANAVEIALSSPSAEISNSYFWRYVAYGASLDIFSDYGEMDKYAQTMPAFQRYKGLVYARTNQQNISQRTYPQF